MKKIIVYLMMFLILVSVGITKEKNVYEDALFECMDWLDNLEKKQSTDFKIYNSFIEMYEDYNQEIDFIKIENSYYDSLALSVNADNPEEIIKNVEDLGGRAFTHYPLLGFRYVFGNKERNINFVLDKKVADCTEIATIQYQILWRNNIPARVVHGYLNGGRHDWIEVLYPDYEQVYWKSIDGGQKKTGEGIWLV